ncbi:MAG: glycosyltransferase 61 family protein [Leptolyngbyaceae cyanobacterium bins.349]|nr:glycosyltransferase 61 family protein [Leptolyngbyaceae cyanobacterium bins.349]
MTHAVMALLMSEQYEAGATYCETAIAQHPESIENYWYLGLIRLLQGDAVEAQAVWLTGLTVVDPATMDTELQTLLTILDTEAARQLTIGQAHLAEWIYQQVLELDADQPWTYLQLGYAVSLQGKLDEAVDYWQTATQLQPDLVEAYVQQATVFQKLAQWDAAIAAYQQAIELQPSSALRYNLALCLSQQYQWGAALEQLNQTIFLQPDFAPAYGDRGWVHLALNQWSAATSDFRAALQIYSNYAQIYSQWVEHLEKSHLPLSHDLRDQAKQLQQLCVAAEVVWQHWVERSPLPPPVPQSFPTAGIQATGYWLDTASWATTQGAKVTYIKLDESSVMTLKPPKTRDRAIHFSFRLEPAIHLPETFVVTIPNGRFWLSADQSSNAIFTASHELLGDLSPEYPLLSPGHPDKHPSHHSVLSRTLPLPQQINGTVAVLAGLTNEMYFHWIFDILPRFSLLVRSRLNVDDIDYFLVSSQLPFQQETLQRLGISSSKFLNVTHYPHLQATQLIVPSYPSSPAWMTKRVCEWLQQVFLESQNQMSKGCDRLYITRQYATNRRIINEVEITEFLRSLDFQIIALESLSVQQQANLLASATVVISAHGGGLTNLTFCQPGTKVLEIFSPNFVYPCYWLVSNLLGLDYYYLTGKVAAGFYLHNQLYPNPRLEDIWIDLAEFKDVVHWMLASSLA